MTKLLRIFGAILLFVLLTLLTQIGGIAFLLAKPFNKLIPKYRRSRLGQVTFFIGIYIFCTFLIVPPIAKSLGRIPLPISNKGMIIPNHFWTCLFNRHYVTPKLYEVIRKSAFDYNANETEIRQLRYLDANFPFFDGFPLLPHRSHDDGEKIDLAFLYINTTNGEPWKKSVSLSGYGFCEYPKSREENMPAQCAKRGYWQYSLLEYMFGKVSPVKVQFDENATRQLLNILSKHRHTKKIFIEPHLKTRLGFSNNGKVRFHGCAAVRHDDHIHIEL